MKNLFYLMCLLMCISSCCEEDATIVTYKLERIKIDITPKPIVLGIAIAPDFTMEGKDLDYTLIIDHETNTFTAMGDYSFHTTFESPHIPEVTETFIDKLKEGTYEDIADDSYVFDKSLLDIELNGMFWSKHEDEELKFVVKDNNNTLTQTQIFTDAKVNNAMNAHIQITSKWRKTN